MDSQKAHDVAQIAGRKINLRADLSAAGCQCDNGPLAQHQTLRARLGVPESDPGPRNQIHPGLQRGGDTKIVEARAKDQDVCRLDFAHQLVREGQPVTLHHVTLIRRCDVGLDPVRRHMRQRHSQIAADHRVSGKTRYDAGRKRARNRGVGPAELSMCKMVRVMGQVLVDWVMVGLFTGIPCKIELNAPERT